MENWRAGNGREVSFMERIVAARLKAELESITPGMVRESALGQYWLNTWELAELTSPSFIAGQLDLHCRMLSNPAGRAEACAALAEVAAKR